MSHTLRRWAVPAMVGLILTVLPPGPAWAQDGPPDDPCAPFQLILNEDGTCVFPTVSTSQVPLVPGAFPDTGWFTYPDPPDDVRTAVGDQVTYPDLDIVETWWTVARLTGQLVRQLNEQDGIQAADTRLNTRNPYLHVVARVDGDTFGPRPAEETLLVGVGTDRNGRPANDGVASTGAPFSFWNGIDTIHQAGQFAAGAFGAGSTQRNGQGEFVGFYNTDSGVWLGVNPDGQSYTILIPIRNIGDTIRIFSQSAQGEAAIADLVGGPFDANGSLPVDGVVAPPVGCVELLQVNPTLVGDGSAAAAIEIRVSGPPTTQPLILDLDLLQGNDPVETPPIPGTVDGDGHAFRVPLPGDGDYRFARVSLYADVNGDGIADVADPLQPVSNANAVRLAKRWLLTGDGRGHLLGDLGCGRDAFWGGTADACAFIGERPDPWDPVDEREYALSGDVAAALGAEGGSLVSGGDDSFSTCTVLGPDGEPMTLFTVFRDPVPEDGLEELAEGLQRDGCTVEPVTSTAFDAGYLRICGGDAPTTGLLTVDRGSGFGLFTQVPRAESLFIENMAPIVLRFRIGDLDADGIPNDEDDDADGDGIPNDVDPDLDDDGIPTTQDRYPLDRFRS